MRCRSGGDARAAGEGCRARGLYAGAIAACGLLGLHHALALARALAADGTPGFVVPLGVLLGTVAADFATGVVHWACDSYGDERTPGVGPRLIRSFREHHRRPRAMLAHDAVDVNGQPAAAAVLGLGLLALPPAQGVLRSAPGAWAFALALFAVSVLGNQLHQWAHTTSAPGPVRWLQRRGWVLSPRAHARHHRPPHASAYCTATGWCNAPLDAVGFWRGLERALERVTGVGPRAAPPGATGGSR